MAERLPRILVTISFAFSIRYIVRTGLLKELKNFSEPVVAITWKQQDLIDELSSQGYEVYVPPSPRYGDLYNNVRRKINYWHLYLRLKSPSRRIHDKFLSQYKKKKVLLWQSLVKRYNILKFLLPGYEKRIFSKELHSLQTNTNYEEIKRWLQQLKIDAVFTVTPFHRQEDLLLRTCKDLGLKMFTAILSFDNITKRGWIPVGYDVYMVWNKYNLSELQRIYPHTRNRKLYITGAPQFDFYFNKKSLLSEEEWRKRLNLSNSKRKIILYAGGPKSIFPDEPQYLKHLDTAISAGKIEGSPVVLLRSHPVDAIERWQEVIGKSDNIFYDTAWQHGTNTHYTNITVDDIKNLCSTLAHTDVHINLCSTMAVDGSAFNKPQIGPAYDVMRSFNGHLLKDMYQQEHFIPIIKVNGVTLAYSQAEFINAVDSALKNPKPFVANTTKVLEEIITYTDGLSTKRVINVLQKEFADL